MKWFLLLCLSWSFSAFSLSHKEFVKLPRDQREKIVKAYKEFLAEYSKSIKISGTPSRSFFELIEEAHAAGPDCVYAGWPSSRIHGLCSSPRSNPSFQRESCGQAQMPCQPLLFGRGLCVPAATRQQRNSSFNNCEKKFAEEGRTLSQVVEYISDPEVSAEADELFRLVDEICSSGVQASTSMCSNLKQLVAKIQGQRQSSDANEKNQLTGPEINPGPETETSVTVAAEQAGQIADALNGLNTQTQCVSCEVIREQTTDEPQRPVVIPEVAADPEPETSPNPTPNSPFPRITSGFNYGDCGGSRGHPDGYEVRNLGSCYNNERVPAGFAFRPGRGHPHMNVETRYPDGSKPGRFFEIVSRNEAFNETFLLMEEYGGGPDSHNVKSYMFVIPRVTVPSVRAEGNTLIATLATGETVTMDKTTKAITSGALTEGPIDLNTDRFQRRPPNIHYNGSGISIRLDHRFEHPLIGSATATVKQGSRTCNVPRERLFDQNGMLKTTTDADLLAVLNQNCRGGGFQLP